MRRSEHLGAIIMSVVVVVAFGAVMVIWVSRPGAPQESPVLNVLVGTLAAGFSTVLNYWLGSSSSSRSKDATIADLSKVGGARP